MKFQKFRWCRDCVHLHIEPAHHDQLPADYDARRQEVLTTIRNYISDNKPHLRWMSFLKSFVLISRGCSKSEFCNVRDPIVADLRSSILEAQQFPRAGIENLWIEYALMHQPFDGLNNLHKKPLVAMKSLLMWKGDSGVDLWGPEENDKFYQIEHLGGIYFSTLAHLPALKYAQGDCWNETV